MLRKAGAVVHVMANVYGERIGQGLADEEWLRDAGERGWVVLMKDAKIRYRPAELQVVVDHGLRANPNLPKTVYHYTDAAGLIGILKNRQIWATHVTYLNDASELLHFARLAASITLRDAKNSCPSCLSLRHVRPFRRATPRQRYSLPRFLPLVTN